MNEIDRRRLLQLGAAALGVGLAGCSGGGGDDDGGDNGGEDNGSEADDDGENGNETDDGGENGGENGGESNEQARETFESVVTTLEEVEAALAEFRNIEGEREELEEQQIPSEGIEELRSQLDDAGSTLSGIDASGDLATQVELAQNVVAFQGLLVDALALWRDHDTAFTEAAIASQSQELETAATEYGNVADTLDNYRSLLDEIESAHADIDSGTFEVDSLSYDQEVWAYLRIDSREELDAREQFAIGEQNRVSGFGDLFEGQDAYGNSEWESAQQIWDQARDDLNAAAQAYSNVLGIDDVPAVIRQDAEDQAEEISDLVEATTLLSQAAQARANGNDSRADELEADAQELLR